MERLKNSANGLLIIMLGGQQIAWGLLKAQELVDTKEFQNKTEAFWVITAWFYGGVFGCRYVLAIKLPKMVSEVS